MAQSNSPANRRTTLENQHADSEPLILGHCHDEQGAAAEPSIFDHCYDEPGAAAFLDTSVRTVQRWRALRRGPPYLKLGNRVLYPRDELLQWAMSQRGR